MVLVTFGSRDVGVVVTQDLNTWDEDIDTCEGMIID